MRKPTEDERVAMVILLGFAISSALIFIVRGLLAS